MRFLDVPWKLILLFWAGLSVWHTSDWLYLSLSEGSSPVEVEMSVVEESGLDGVRYVRIMGGVPDGTYMYHEQLERVEDVLYPLFSKGRLAILNVVGKDADKTLTQAHIVVVQAVSLRKDSLETWSSDHLARQVVTVEGVVTSKGNRLSDSDRSILTSSGLSLADDYMVVEAGERPPSIWTSIIAFIASISALAVMLYMGSRSLLSEKRSEQGHNEPPIPFQPPYEPQLRSFLGGFIKASGRMSRGRYALSFFVLLGILPLLVLSAASGSGFFMLIFILSRIPLICLHVQRLHDVNYSGWYVLYSLVGIDTIVLIPYLLLKSGNPAANRYGPPTSPVPQQRMNSSQDEPDDIIGSLATPPVEAPSPSVEVPGPPLDRLFSSRGPASFSEESSTSNLLWIYVVVALTVCAVILGLALK